MLRFSEHWSISDGYTLYLLGRDQDIPWDIRNVDKLLEVGSGWHLHLAGRFWPDDRYDPRILDRLLEVGDGYDLYVSGRDWSNERYDSRVAQALIDTKEMKYIRAALGKSGTYDPWPPERIRDIVMTWQGTGEDDA